MGGVTVCFSLVSALLGYSVEKSYRAFPEPVGRTG